MISPLVLIFYYKLHHASVFLDLAGFEPATLKGLTPMLWSIIFSYRRVPFAWKIGIATYQKTRLTIWWINGARWNRTTDTQGFNLLLYLTELSRLNAPTFSELVDMSKSIHCSVPFLFQRTSHRHYTDWLRSPIWVSSLLFICYTWVTHIIPYFTVGSYHRIEPLSLQPQ